jgi:ApaG protein
MATATGQRSLGSDTVTHGVRVQVSPSYLPEGSDPGADRYHFAYHVVISNDGDARITLRRRHWSIVDADGGEQRVDGEGVVGEQPTLEPGGRFEYQSYAALTTAWGTMEGSFTFERDDRSEFDASVARFFLVAAEPRRRK